MRSNKRVDFQALRQRVPIEQVCHLLGIQLKKTGDRLRGSCAICNHDSTRCFVVTPKLQVLRRLSERWRLHRTGGSREADVTQGRCTLPG